MGPYSDEALNRQSLKWPQRLKDTPDPAGHLSGRVDVVGLGVLGEALLNVKKKGSVNGKQSLRLVSEPARIIFDVYIVLSSLPETLCKTQPWRQ